LPTAYTGVNSMVLVILFEFNEKEKIFDVIDFFFSKKFLFFPVLIGYFYFFLNVP